MKSIKSTQAELIEIGFTRKSLYGEYYLQKYVHAGCKIEIYDTGYYIICHGILMANGKYCFPYETQFHPESKDDVLTLIKLFTNKENN